MTSQHSRGATVGAAAGVVTGVGLLVGSLVGPVSAAAAPVPLGTATSFSVLAGSGITNTGPTTVFGDIGTFPTTTISGLAGITVGGVNHGGDAVTQGAKSDLVTAYNTAAGALPPTVVTTDLGGSTLVPGIYKAAASMGLTGALTLNAGGDPNAVFIFQAGSTLITASDSSVVLLNGAQACNIFWQVGSSATFGTRTAFRGNVLAHTSITANTKATFEGRLLASNGAVTLDTNVITRPGCATGKPSGGSTATTSPPAGAGGSTATTAPSAGATGAPAGTPGTAGSTGTGGTGHGGGGGPAGTHPSGTAGILPTSTDTGGPGTGGHGRLPDTGGPDKALMILGLLAATTGTALILVSRGNRRGAHARGRA